MWFLLACALFDPCVRPLEQHCWGDETSGPTCPLLTIEDVTPSFRCGDYDVATSGPNFTGNTLYFDRSSGELVAAAYWSDVATSCGDWTLWSGQRIDCEPTCTFEEGDDDLPACD